MYLHKGHRHRSSGDQHSTLADHEGHAIEATVLEDLRIVEAGIAPGTAVRQLDVVGVLLPGQNTLPILFTSHTTTLQLKAIKILNEMFSH